ncbi:MAG: hypothetical protein D6739_07530, partial [Nitrospirae bacterium]
MPLRLGAATALLLAAALLPGRAAAGPLALEARPHATPSGHLLTEIWVENVTAAPLAVEVGVAGSRMGRRLLLPGRGRRRRL